MEERRLQGKQRPMAELKRTLKEAEDKKNRRSGAGSDWRRAYEALCTSRVERETWSSESVQLQHFLAKEKRNSTPAVQ